MVSRVVARFRTIHVNDINSMVWAVDSDHNVFVRKGLTSDLPVGSSWIHVVGEMLKLFKLPYRMKICMIVKFFYYANGKIG